MFAQGELVLELTDWCPLHCRHCSSQSGRECRNSIDLALAVRLLSEARRLGAVKIAFGGGEPTAAMAFSGALSAAAELGLRTEVFTCGTGLETSGLAPFPQRLVALLSGLPELKVIFSLHGPDAALHDAITQSPSSFDCMLTSIRACSDSGIRCEANFVPIRPNFTRFQEVVALAAELGVQRVSVLRFVPQGRGGQNRAELELSAAEEGAFVAALPRIQSATGVDIRTGSPFNGIIPSNTVPCRAGASKLVVQADGNVLPCEVFKDARRRAWGLSVYNHTLAEVLMSPQLEALRQRLAASRCLECPVHSALREARSPGKEHAAKAETISAR